MLWKIALIFLGIISITYYVVICAVLKKWDSTFSRFCLIAGIICLAATKAVDVSGFSYVVKVGIAFLAGIFLLTEGIIVRGMFCNRQKECHYLIILGAQVNGRRITDSLQRRLDCALSYLSRHPKTRVVVSGGQGEKEERTEADAMEEYLLCHGIEKHRIILEERSRTTRENLLYSMELIGDRTEPVGIVSNNFHLYRACSYARQLGYTDPCPVKADCHPVLFMNYMVRECLAVWKMWMIKLLTKNLTVL